MYTLCSVWGLEGLQGWWTDWCCDVPQGGFTCHIEGLISFSSSSIWNILLQHIKRPHTKAVATEVCVSSFLHNLLPEFQINISGFQKISLQVEVNWACESWMQIFCRAKFSMTNLTAAQEAEYREAFLIFDRNGDGKITNEVIFSRSMGNSNMPKLIHYEKTMDFKTI